MNQRDSLHQLRYVQDRRELVGEIRSSPARSCLRRKGEESGEEDVGSLSVEVGVESWEGSRGREGDADDGERVFGKVVGSRWDGRKMSAEGSVDDVVDGKDRSCSRRGSVGSCRSGTDGEDVVRRRRGKLGERVEGRRGSEVEEERGW